MDPEIAELAGTGAATLMTLLTTDGWHLVKERFASLWGHFQPERARAIAGELEATRDDLLDAQNDGDPRTVTELGAEWQGRIRRLLTVHPEVLGELRNLLAELAPDRAAEPSVTQQVTASGHARVYQAGRDQNFGQR